ncbi:plant UBX domain-containing protein 7 isoform X2 [Amborella trichopoda]|uniref:plant UBX domain-containing protein 7 isoform X2 n=1 Tax=Amborella trichopoda TaxID=13333 RepID=UPI0005D42F6D|nr:plant UBX domain-containing protein 7 isoform X2 [Amborella trichopoda]|eukprot:XP_011627484.1 plant UBX domain-containing protein 7 isoform X2 [Amborella trichopoda]
MESLSDDKQILVASFMEVAGGESTKIALQFLQATNWQLEDAIQLFFVGNDGNNTNTNAESSSFSPPKETNHSPLHESEQEKDAKWEEYVRPPLPVKREALYADSFIQRTLHPPHQPVAFRDFEEEAKNPSVWGSEQGTSGARDNLAALYRPPFSLMYQGSFEKAKIDASRQGKWLLINIQSTKEFSSHMLNRDTWSNEAVAQTIRTTFVFWQIYDDTDEGRKVCTYYNLTSIPVVLVIDPVTGQKMRGWSGMVGPDRLLEDLVPYMDKGPMDHHPIPHKRPRETTPAAKATLQDKHTEDEDEEIQRAFAASLEGMKEPMVPSNGGDNRETDSEAKVEQTCPSTTKPSYPPLPEEPKGDRSLLCRVGVRLPDGRRLQRNFLRKDPIQLLWSFCCSEVKEANIQPFKLTQAIPGASKYLDYNSNLTFEESGLLNSMISLTWD